MQIVSYGGGTNSTAMLVGLHERGERPEHIIFADTGSEKPHTYLHIEEVRKWCASVGFPDITIIKGDQPQQVIDGSLHEECLRLHRLPSKAYGFGGCSLKWKVEPQYKYLRGIAKQNCIEMKQIVSLVGFDANEISRVERQKQLGDKAKTAFRYPLVEWDWGREECVAAIARAGLPQPGKSACFMCPSSKKWEIFELRDKYPELMKISIKMEVLAKANGHQVGLGRRFYWGDLLKASDAQEILFSDHGIPEIDCGCYDGE